MKINNQGPCLSISEIPELTAVNSADFGNGISAAHPTTFSIIEIDLSQTRFIDSSGLGVLFALYRTSLQGKGVTLRLLNPRPEIDELLELTRMRQLYEVVRR